MKHQHRDRVGVYGYPHPLLAEHQNQVTQASHNFTLALEEINICDAEIERIKKEIQSLKATWPSI
jgi:hypothetical protein